MQRIVWGHDFKNKTRSKAAGVHSPQLRSAGCFPPFSSPASYIFSPSSFSTAVSCCSACERRRTSPPEERVNRVNGAVRKSGSRRDHSVIKRFQRLQAARLFQRRTRPSRIVLRACTSSGHRARKRSCETLLQRESQRAAEEWHRGRDGTVRVTAVERRAVACCSCNWWHHKAVGRSD